jgi:hypothetical protein
MLLTIHGYLLGLNVCNQGTSADGRKGGSGCQNENHFPMETALGNLRHTPGIANLIIIFCIYFLFYWGNSQVKQFCSAGVLIRTWLKKKSQKIWRENSHKQMCEHCASAKFYAIFFLQFLEF